MGWKRKAFGLTILLFLWVIGCDGFRSDEIKCEDAVAHLANCCSNLVTEHINCVYAAHSCGTTYPDIPEATSDCILGASCDTLRGSVCTEVTNAGQNVDGTELKCP